MRGYNILADILQMVVFSLLFVISKTVFEGEVQEVYEVKYSYLT